MAMDASFASNNNNAAPDLFGDNKSKGDWYFYNPALKSKGLTEFKVKWGTRPNVTVIVPHLYRQYPLDGDHPVTPCI